MTSEATKAQAEKMDRLEHQFHTLRKELLDREKMGGWFGLLLSLVGDFLMLLPLTSILAGCITLAGGKLVLANKDDILVVAQRLDIGEAGEKAIHNLRETMSSVYLINGLAVLAAFPATGKLRKWIFGYHHAHGFRLFLQWLVGPFVFGIIGILLGVVFASVFGVTVALIPASTMLTITAGACEAGQEARSGLAAALVAISAWRPDPDDFQASVLSRMGGFCTSDRPPKEIIGAADEFYQGTALMLLGQLLQLSSHVGKMTEVLMQEDMEEEGHKSAVRDYRKRAAARAAGKQLNPTD